MAKKKTPKPQKTCGDCIHEHACTMWNIGTIHEMNATNCANHETARESAAYLIGKMEAQQRIPAEQEMPKLIAANDLYNALDMMGRMFMPGEQKDLGDAVPYFAEQKVFETLAEQPAVDAVPVVRCKDCVSCYKSEASSTGYQCEEFCVYEMDYECDPNGFCHKGERKN